MPNMLLMNTATDNGALCAGLPAVDETHDVSDKVVLSAAIVDSQPSSAVAKAPPTDHDRRYRTNRDVLIMRVAEVLREATQRHGVNLTILAMRMRRRSRVTVSRILSGAHNLTLSSIADLATALGKRVQITLIDDAPLVRAQMNDQATPTMWNLLLFKVDSQQTLLYLPKDIGGIPREYVAEFTYPKVDALELTLVDPDTPARERRYQVVRHHGGVWTSVPRPWLRDRSARDGDYLRITRLSWYSFAIELVRE
jgi:hypothetical protein